MDKIPKESPTHILEVGVDMCNGYLTPKEGGRKIYLSTHSFYRTGHKNTTRILQECGFNVTIKIRIK